ncbi:MAG: glycoside hydrolase family 2 protein [Rikenellaceae bacterium]|nr:glycoside hydrolase family 2 protein [Rikenellaceae bacterium]
MLKKFISSVTVTVLSLILATGLSGCGETKTKFKAETGKIEWPEVTYETKPWTRWWWHGSAVTEEGLNYTLETYHKAGLGGVEITPIYGVRETEDMFIEYLSPEWMDKLAYTLDKARSLDMGVDLANASGWPFGGPWVEEESVSKYMASQVFRVEGGSTLSETIKYDQRPVLRMEGPNKLTIEQVKKPYTANGDLQEHAFDQIRYPEELTLFLITANRAGNDGTTEVIDLTDKVKDGRLEWTAPEGGEWIVCALFQGNHGKMVERAGPGGEGFAIDHFSTDALDKYLAKFDEAFEGYDISHIRHFFNDSYEVDDAQGDSNWTPMFFEEFKKLRGYDLKQYIPALLGLDKEEINIRVLYDYRATISDLLLERFTGHWQKWAAGKGKGIRNQSHGAPANVLDLYAASDIPEIEGRELVNLKSAASAAHVTGKNIVGCESATWLNDHFESSLGDVKDAIDTYFLAGVNHVVYHGTAYSPEDAEWPGWLFYAAVHFHPSNSFWEDFGAFNQYVARAQSFLQSGRPSNDVLLYFNISDLWSTPGRNMLQHFHSNKFFDEVTLKENGMFLSENGYSWDAITDRQLNSVSYKNGELIARGNSYKVIMVPESHYMPLETFEKLLRLAEQGATVLFHKCLPADVPGFADFEKSKTKMASLKEKISFVENGDRREAKYGKGKIIISVSQEELIGNSGLEAESIYKSGLQSIRRIKEDGNFYYFIKNSSGKQFDGWISLNAEYTSAAVYNLMTGTAGYLRTRNHNGATEIYLQMRPDESFVIETFKGEYSGEVYPFYEKSGNQISLSEDYWTLEFIKGGPTLPQRIEGAELQSWTNYGRDYAVFSGTAEYTTTLNQLPADADAYILDLGRVYESASVYLNGEYIGTLFNEPYSIEIPADMFNGNDRLTVRVSNLMANRIIDMDRRGIQWRNFYNINMSARRAENRGADGKFSAANWDPKNSGLAGPVTLTPVKMTE